MFDIGFWELCIIAIVALLILGPERLPLAARTAGLWIAKGRRLIGNVKNEIDRELQLDELRQRLKDEEIKIREDIGLEDIKGFADNTIADAKSFHTDLNSDLSSDKKVELDPTNSDEDNKTTEDASDDTSHGEYEPPTDQSEKPKR